MIINKTYKYRIKPTKEQRALMESYFGNVRFIYNYFLNQRIEQYHKTGKSDNYKKQCNLLCSMKKTEQYGWLKTTNSGIRFPVKS